jgi:hypothetical protein
MAGRSSGESGSIARRYSTHGMFNERTAAMRHCAYQQGKFAIKVKIAEGGAFVEKG